MRWTVEEWKSCLALAIRNCFTHFFKRSGDKDRNIESEVEKEALKSMERDDS